MSDKQITSYLPIIVLSEVMIYGIMIKRRYMKRKVLFTLNHLVVGGVEAVILDILDNLDYDLYDVTLLLWHNSGEWDSKINKNVRVVYISKNRSINRLRAFRILPKLHKTLLLRDKYDVEIVFRHDLAQVYSGFFSKSARKYIWVHGDVYYQEKFREMMVEETSMEQKLYLETFKQADKIVCCSSNSKESFDEMLPCYSFKTVTLSNAIDVANIQQKSKENIDMNGEYIVTVSRLDTNKNVIDVIKAYQEINAKYGEYKLVIVGDGDKRSMLEEYVNAHDLVDNVIFLGRQDNPYKYMSRAKLFLSASVEEAFGLVAVESMAVGVPVVSYDNRGAVYLSDDGSCHIVESNVASLAAGALQLLNDKDMYEKKCKLSYDLANTFDITNYMVKVNNLLEEDNA